MAWGELLLAFAAISFVCCAATWYFYTRGNLLWYGDAEAHLAVARRIVDSRTPGYPQIGTVWLPLPHVLMLPFVINDDWFRTGLAGAIPSTACFIFAACCLYAAVRLSLSTAAAAALATALFVLNPNILYLQAIPMTEPIYFAALMALLVCTVAFSKTQSTAWIIGAGIASCAASLTRYDGWITIPFVCLYFLFTAERRWRAAILFGLIASLAPIYWLIHNWWYFGDPLEFYRGEYSARAIAIRTSNGNHKALYPGDHDLQLAWFYFRSAAQVVAGPALSLIGLLGIIAALARRTAWPVILFLISPLFYVWNIYNSTVPIFIPTLEPHGYYNSRYALSSMPLLALGGAALVTWLPTRVRWPGAAAVLILALAPWALTPAPDGWLCWKESEVNSASRRAWTAETAAYLEPRYKPGTGIFTMLGDLTGVYRESGIPFRELLHDGNNPHWLAASHRPDLFLWEDWAVVIAGSQASDAIHNAIPKGLPYRCVKIVEAKDAPSIEIFRRQ